MTEGSGNASENRGYVGTIRAAAKSVLEGMAVTLSYMFRPPTTIQYPDRLPAPLTETLPERYRGFLEVDMDICTACKACERDCPINVIVIDLEKVGDVRAMTRFDIDMGKCMYCGICVEACPTDAHAPQDEEDTKCIRMTREFEAATESFPSLTFRFIRPGDAVVPFKPKKGVIEPTRRRGEIAREVRRKAVEYNTLAVKWAMENGGAGKSDDLVNAPEVVQARAAELLPMVEAAGDDPQKVEDLLYAQALAQTDCEACGYPTCREYAIGMIKGDNEYFKCEPGGAQATRDVTLIFQIRKGAFNKDGTKKAA